uniref:Phosphoinositide interacting regulator of transient receptor potential channels n=1 Tax=Amphilophus citrinellus TaxID=61819 RepID=A0A3Q0R8B2_AMPCI
YWLSSYSEYEKFLLSCFVSTMETSFPGDYGSMQSYPDPQPAAAAGPGCTYLHKPIIVMVMGSLMSAAGALLFLLQYSGVIEAPRSVASTCLSLGLMFVVMGLVWVPILKEKQRRKQISHGA